MNRGFQLTPADLRQGSASFFERHPIQVDEHCGRGLCHSATQWLPVTGPASTVDLFLILKCRTASSRLDRGGPFSPLPSFAGESKLLQKPIPSPELSTSDQGRHRQIAVS